MITINRAFLVFVAFVLLGVVGVTSVNAVASEVQTTSEQATTLTPAGLAMSTLFLPFVSDSEGSLPTPTPTSGGVATPAASATSTDTATIPPSATPTPTDTSTMTPSATPTDTATMTPSATPTDTATTTPSATPTITPTPTSTPCGIISGVISSDRILSSDCTFIVSGNVLIDQNVVVTITQGVTLKFDPDRYLQVEGALVASGIDSKPIRFTHSSELPWGGIRINTQSGSKSVLEYTIIEYVNTLYTDRKSALHVMNAQPTLEHITLQHNFLPLRLWAGDGFTATLRNSAILSNTGAALMGYGTNILENVLVQNNSPFFDSGVLRICPGSVVKDSQFISNQSSAIFVNQCSAGETQIIGNYFDGSTTAIEDTSLQPLRIHGNDIEQDTYAPLISLKIGRAHV